MAGTSPAMTEPEDSTRWPDVPVQPHRASLPALRYPPRLGLRRQRRRRAMAEESQGVAAADARLNQATMMGLGAMALGVFVVANDFTALSVAIPNIEHDLRRRSPRAVGDQRVRTGVRRADRHRGAAGRPLRPQAHVHPRRGDLRDVLGAGRAGAHTACCSLPRADGRGRRAHVAGDPRYDVRAAARRRRASPAV